MILSWDTETEPISRGKLAPSPVSVSWAYEGTKDLELFEGSIGLIRGWLIGPDTLIGANVAYDMAVAAEAAPELLPLVFEKYARLQVQDVQINQKIIDIAARGGTKGMDYSLAALCGRYDLPSPDKEGPWRMEFAALRGIPVPYWPESAVKYVLDDAERPLEIFARQVAYDAAWRQSSGGYPLLHVAPREAYKAFCLHLVSCWGLRADGARVEVLRARLDAYLGKAGRVLRRVGLVRKDGTRNTKAAKEGMERVCTAKGFEVPRTDTGQVSLDKEAAHASGSPVLQMYSDYSQSATLVSRVQDLAEGATSPLQVRFDTLLETSRVSASKPRPPLVGVQAQNFPRELTKSIRPKKGEPWVPGARECLEPRPGHLFVSCDLPSAELRSLAQGNIDLFGQAVMADQLNAGRDLHMWFGAQMLGIAYEEALALSAAEDKQVKDARQHAKPCNFGFPGGMGVKNFIAYAYMTYRVRFSPEKATQLKAVWLAAFPEMEAYFAWVDRTMGGNERALHRHIRSGRYRGKVTYCGRCNTNFQELTANAASDGLIEAQRRAYTVRSSALWESRTVMYTHDEIVMETPIDMAHSAGLELSAVMAEQFNAWHPDVHVLPCTGPTKDTRTVAPCVSRIYSKDMRGVWAGGRLGVWSPEGFAA